MKNQISLNFQASCSYLNNHIWKHALAFTVFQAYLFHFQLSQYGWWANHLTILKHNHHHHVLASYPLQISVHSGDNGNALQQSEPLFANIRRILLDSNTVPPALSPELPVLQLSEEANLTAIRSRPSLIENFI